MSDFVSVNIEGVDKLITRLQSVASKAYLRATMRAAVEHLKGKVATYPDATSANARTSTPGMSWYERGMGTHYNRIRDGGESVYRTSKALGRKWTTSVNAAGDEARVGNNVSYGPYAQDKELQTWYHKATGWKTIQTVAEDEKDKIIELFQNSIEKALSK